MKAPENIDEILKNGMENFHPTPPADVWAQLEQSLVQSPVGHSQTNLGNVSKIVKLIKSASIVTKVVLLAVVPAMVGVYLVMQADPGKQPVTASKRQAAEITRAAEPVRENASQSEAETTQKLSQLKSPATSVPTESYKKVTDHSTGSQNTKQPVEVDNNTNPIAGPDNQAVVPPAKPLAEKSEPKENKPKETKPEETQPIPVPQLTDKPQTESKLEFKSPMSNVITPNGDMDNDKFIVELLNAKLFNMKVYDYRGNIVFETSDPTHFWDGKDSRSGQDCEAGRYTYSIDYQLNNSKLVQNKIGIISIIR